MQQMTKNMRNEAYSELRYRIMHNKFIPGQKISEKTISEELGIGRTPVREAIIRIERDGLIDVIPQSGTYISQIDMENQLGSSHRDTPWCPSIQRWQPNRYPGPP